MRRAHKKLGRDIEIARKRRRITQQMVCERASISSSTYQRLIAGDREISIGVFSMVLMAIGLDGRFFQNLDSSNDMQGLLLEETRLPKAIRRRKQK